MGHSQYWEVKTRARADVDPLTGQSEHWIDYAAFRDYLSVSESAQMKVWVILYEAPSAVSGGRWLRVDVRRLREVGRVDQRRGASGDLVRAWVWLAAEMEVVVGPDVDVAGPEAPLLPREGRPGTRWQPRVAPAPAERTSTTAAPGMRWSPLSRRSTSGTAVA